MKSIRSFLLLATATTAALGLAAGAPASANDVSYLCELDRTNQPVGCFYVNKSDLKTLVRQYSQNHTINPVRPTPTTSQTGAPISFPGVK